MTPAVNVATRDAVVAAIETARRAGATIVTEPADRVWGGRSAHRTTRGHHLPPRTLNARTVPQPRWTPNTKLQRVVLVDLGLNQPPASPSA